MSDERDRIPLGIIPEDEDDNYLRAMTVEQIKLECERFKRLLDQYIPVPDRLPNVEYAVELVDFGGGIGEMQVVICFDSLNEDECEFVFESVEPSLPRTWLSHLFVFN